MKNSQKCPNQESALSGVVARACRALRDSPFADLWLNKIGLGQREQSWRNLTTDHPLWSQVTEQLFELTEFVETNVASDTVDNPCLANSSLICPVQSASQLEKRTTDQLASHLAILATFHDSCSIPLVRMAWREIRSRMAGVLRHAADTASPVKRSHAEYCLWWNLCFEPSGLIVLGSLLGDPYEQFVACAHAQPAPFVQLERSTLGFDHRQVIHGLWEAFDLGVMIRLSPVDGISAQRDVRNKCTFGEEIFSYPFADIPTDFYSAENQTCSLSSASNEVHKRLDKLDQLVTLLGTGADSSEEYYCHTMDDPLNSGAQATDTVNDTEPVSIPGTEAGTDAGHVDAVTGERFELFLEETVHQCRNRRLPLSLVLVEWPDASGYFRPEKSQPWEAVLASYYAHLCPTMCAMRLPNARVAILLPAIDRPEALRASRKVSQLLKTLCPVAGPTSMAQPLSIAVVGCRELPRSLRATNFLRTAEQCLESAIANGGGIKSLDVT